MTITYTWAILQMDAYPELNGMTDVVFTVHWTLTGIDGTYIGSVYDSTGVSLVEGSPFTPYADLTETQVIEWVQSTLGEEKIMAYEADIAEQITSQIYPTVITPALPWSRI